MRALVLVLGVVVDHLFGDPDTKFHPVALLGSLISVWGVPARYMHYSNLFQRLIGVFFWICTVFLFTLPYALFEWYASPLLYLIGAPFLFSSCMALSGLLEHARSVSDSHDMMLMRKNAQNLVSRDTSEFTHEQALSAAYESVSENLTDSIIAPLFYFCLFGLPGIALYRAANTMDAMLGYLDERRNLGWCAARADDVLSYIPARITGLFLIMYFWCIKRGKEALAVYHADRNKRPGYNGGIPISLIAGGVGVQFEKPGVYVIGIKERMLSDAKEAILHTIVMTTVAFILCAVFTLMILELRVSII
ncbi:MAG: adenosylcobinamide-phosphate synthase CbiB [Methanomicrobiales archaeon]|nr:adenosylcobinamide-phosphate synthase CbiB [Methanomicrobiales archaeon]